MMNTDARKKKATEGDAECVVCGCFYLLFVVTLMSFFWGSATVVGCLSTEREGGGKEGRKGKI